MTKKGYLTISVNHTKDGRVFLRRHEGIKEWYSMIKVISNYYDNVKGFIAKGKRKAQHEMLNMIK